MFAISSATNITTTSRYLRSTTLQLEWALTLLEQHEAQRALESNTSPRQNRGTIATSLPHGRSGARGAIMTSNRNC